MALSYCRNETTFSSDEASAIIFRLNKQVINSFPEFYFQNLSTEDAAVSEIKRKFTEDEMIFILRMILQNWRLQLPNLIARVNHLCGDLNTVDMDFIMKHNGEFDVIQQIVDIFAVMSKKKSELPWILLKEVAQIKITDKESVVDALKQILSTKKSPVSLKGAISDSKANMFSIEKSICSENRTILGFNETRFHTLLCVAVSICIQCKGSWSIQTSQVYCNSSSC